MFRIRRLFDDTLPLDAREIAQVQDILRARFSAVRDDEITNLPARLRDPVKYGWRYLLFVADDLRGQVRGFALIAHDPKLEFVYLDWIASGNGAAGGGVGGALYERVRDEAKALRARGVLFECLPDTKGDVSDAELKENAARMRFYERYGARPIVNNDYREPVGDTPDPGLPYLMLDPLDGEPLGSARAQRVVAAILERKYAYLCPPDYVARVAASFRDDPVQLRPFRYVKPGAASPSSETPRADMLVDLVVNEQHDVHHVRDRGYVEAPVRVRAILRELEPSGLFRRVEARSFPDRHIRAVHDGAFVDYLKRVCAGIPPERSVYPYVFPVRNAARPPKELSVRAGYYCIDTFTPLNANAYLAARHAVDCTLTAADAVLSGRRLAYALVRPPGHHAERATFGGFCYFNNGAVAAHYLSQHGRVAMLDVDYHHGNGQQDIFYERADVLTVSLHGHPSFAYPYFSGFADEKGRGAGEGMNVNFPLPETLDGAGYRTALRKAVGEVRRFSPNFLVVALGLDPAKGDPTGTWTLAPVDFRRNGEIIGALRLPTLVVQEGGYRTRSLGNNARSFFEGLVAGMYGSDR
ncbi:MAG: histone deacetylase family protein [Alphaproteobacteria bacterium]|nr:histone deacetylase family protein [Alphaproteobacteria bacterium]